MVFESIVADMINKYLGEFVEDLDKSQLSIGIWSGDVVLKKLNLKETALNHFNIPVKIKAGHLGKLTLKVPWKNLYTEPVVVHMQDIYALTVPDTAVQYDLEMDRQAQFAEKLARLAQIEMQKKLEAEKAKPWDPTQDTFVEKLSIQIIKNLQIKVTSLHFRHEDAFNNPKRPISIGITLKELVFQTTDASWKETVIKEAVSQIYKLVRLDSLSVYWNSKSDLMQEKSKKHVLNALADNIPKLGSKSNLQYLFQPISAVAHLRLNTKPELMSLALPKIQLTLVFDEITMNLSKDQIECDRDAPPHPQFDDILEMLESIERMSLRSKYMATRPGVPYTGNAKLWWRHAYAVVLKYTVQRRRNMWKWHIIKKHRENLKQYRELYTLKLAGRKLSKRDLAIVATIEEELDILNICICRNQAELDVARMDKKRGEKSKMTKWFTGWFGGKESERSSIRSSQSFLPADFNKFSEEFTDDEKGKLYHAIGYDENAKDATYPLEFVSVRLVVKLNKLSAVLMGDKRSKENPLLKMMLTEICASFGQRPAANAIRLDMKVDQLIAIGAPRYEYTPKLINSVGVSKEANISLLTVAFETNPLDNLCDTRVRINSRPLEMIYDAVTVNGLATFFRPPESVKLRQLSNAAMAKYDEIISQTTAGVIYMMSERKYADIEVHLMPSYIIVPETGELKKDVKMLLLNLGSLNVTSEKNKEMTAGTQLSQKELASYAYDKFNVSLENVQLLFVQPGDTWQNESQSVNSPLYILQPMSMQILVEKCIFSSDPNFPQFQMSGILPIVAVTVSDNKLLAILNLIQSIPLPAPPPEPKFDFEEELFDESSRMTALNLTRLSKVRGDSKLTSEFRNLTTLSVTFIIQEVSLEIRETHNKIETPFLQFIITRIGANLKVRTFDLSLEVILGGIYLKHLQYKISQNIRHQLEKCQVLTEENVNIINSPFVDEDEPLLSIRFIKANRKGPEFKTTYNNTSQSFTVEFSTLDIVLHQGVLLSLLDFFKKFETSSAKQFNPPTDLHKRATSTLSLISQRSFVFADRSKPRADIQLLKVKALVDNIQLSLCNAKCVIMHSRVEGIEFGIGMQHQTTGVTTLMRKIEVTDPDPMTYHPAIFSVQGTDMLRLELTHFKNPTKDINNIDAVLSLQMGRAQIVFVNKFFMSIVHFFDNFAVAKAKLDEARRIVQEASMDMAKNLQVNVPHVKFDIMVFKDSFQTKRIEWMASSDAMVTKFGNLKKVNIIIKTKDLSNIKAPLIVVPQNSRSQSVLNVHLGDVTVHNRFEHGNIRGKRDTWVVENMIVKLTNLCISRGIVQHGSTSTAAEITLLEPLSFIVDIRRNLSNTYYHDIPSIEVKGVLEKIDIKLNQEDVRLIMQIATENVDERYADGPTSAKAKLVIVRDKRISSKQRSPTSCISKMSMQTPRETYCFLKLDFKLLAINIELYRGLVNLLDTEAAKLPERLLTYLALNTLRVNYSMQSDNSILTSLYLHDINMDDCRQEKVGGITKLIRRTAFKTLTRAALKLRAKEAKENMVLHMNFEENINKDKTINGHICSLHLCICLEFLMKVMEFFSKSVPVKDPDEVNRTTEMKAILENKDAVKDMKIVPPMVGSIDISVKLEKPEIYLIEDQMNPHTDSLIVNLELAFHMYMSQDTLSMNGGISRFSLISCVFEKDDANKSYFRYFKWSQDKTRKISSIEKELLEICYNYYEHKWEMLPILNYVLTPLDITIIGSGPQNKDHHVDVVMTDFILSVTPSTVRLLTAIAASMNLTPEPDMTSKKQKDYSHIWDKKNLSDCNYWFTQSVVETEPVPLTDKKTSTFDLTASPSMTDAQTITILYVKEKFLQRKVRYYGNQIKELLPRYLNIYVRCTLGIEIAYNNENIGVWEPVLEPVVNTRKSTSRKWDIVLEMVKNPVSDDISDDKLLPPPKMTVNIVATQPLNLVLSKTCLKVLYQLVEAFQEAYQLREFEGTIGQHVYPYLFRNMLGVNIRLIPENSFEVVAEHMSMDLNEFQSGTEVSMDIATKKVLFKDESLIRSTQPVEKMINIRLEGSTTSYDVYIKSSKKRVFTFDNDKVVVTVEVLLGQKIISFKSLVQIKNHLNVPMLIKYKGSDGIVIAGEVYPNSMFSLPLNAVSSSSGELFFQPKTEDSRFSACKEGVLWKTLTYDTQVTQITCETIEEGRPSYYFNILPEFEKIHEGNTRELKSEMVYLHLHPTVILHNQLPFIVHMSLKGTGETHKLEAGHQIPLSHASVNESVLQIEIPDYRNQWWIGHTDISHTAPQLSTLTFRSVDSGDIIYMFLGHHCKLNEGSLDISVYSPYWIVNLTKQDIALKKLAADSFYSGTNSLHDDNKEVLKSTVTMLRDNEIDKETVFYNLKEDKEVMLFYFDHTQEFHDETDGKTADEKATRCASCLNCASKPFQSHKRVCLKIANAQWSDKFSLDTVGSYGHVTCINSTKGHLLKVGVNITLASSGLTKIVTFTPFYLLLNASSVQLSVREQNNFNWIELNPGECRDFYPTSTEKEIKVIAKVHDSLNETLPFYANKTHTTLLRLCDKFGGINAECQVTDSTTITILKTYKPGMATGLLVNYMSNFSVTIKQVGVPSDVHVLEPNTSEMYTWTEPTAKREVMWTCGNKRDVRSTLDRDKIEGFVMQTGVKFYLVSFLDGLQRVIMFTEDATSATLALEAGELEQADQEINVKIYEVGFSLVNNEKLMEVVYMGINSSGIIWEQKKTNFKMLKTKDAENMEKAYQKYKLDNVKPTTTLAKIDNVEVDFKNMQVMKPYTAGIRRSFEDGIWMQIRKSPHSLQFHAKINRLQIDNQMKDSIFPTILSPVALSRSVTSSNVPVPFIELCLIIRIHRYSSLQQIKYFKVLIQEMNIKIDQSFINGVLTIFASDAGTAREKELTQFKEDVALTMRDLKEEVGISMLSMRVSFFDYFHISPIKINFSFSLQGGKVGDAAYSSVMGIFLQSVGVVLTDVHDVVFKLGYFEKKYSFCDNSKLMKEFIIHYTGQAIKQMYVLVLGLDVLGNPFGLLRGLTEGIEDLFYEPYQGAIQGPDEFLEGLALGVRSLFGHTVGGTAGAVSKITGTLGKGLAALAFDKNYQQKRTEQSRKIPSNSREAFALGGKELVMGVYSGVTGVVTLPLTGARQKGLKGFVKGMGMGLVGVFIKPVSGVMGFASRSLEGIYRMTDIREDIKHLRPAHTFSRDGVMNPYNYEEAEGCSLLVEIDRCKYVDTDDYLAHVKLKEDNKTIKIVFIVTDKRIMLARRSNIFGVWNTEWMFTYDDLAGVPEATDKGIEFVVRAAEHDEEEEAAIMVMTDSWKFVLLTPQDKDRKTMFLGDTFKKELAIPDPEVAQVIAFKIMEAMQMGVAVVKDEPVMKDEQSV